MRGRCRGPSFPPLSKAWPGTTGTDQKSGKSEQDVDGEERVLTKSVVAPELILRGSADHSQTREGAVISCLSGQKY